MQIVSIQDEEEQELFIDELEEKYPNNEYVLYIKGNFAIKTKKLNKAKKLLERLLPRAPHLALFPLGQIEEEMKNYGAALSYYEKAIQAEPLDDLSHNALANTIQHLAGDYIKAKTHYLEAIRLAPYVAGYHFNLAHLILWHKDSDKDYTAAKYHLEETLSLEPNIAEAHQDLGIIYRNIELNYPLARKHYEAVLDINPDYFDAHNSLGILFNQNISEPELAKKHLEKAIKLQPDNANSYYNLARVIAEHFKDYRMAEILYKKSIELDPKSPNARLDFAKLLADYLHNYPEARANFEALLSLYPDMQEGKYQYARILANRFNEHGLLENYFNEQLKLKPMTANEHHNRARFFGLTSPRPYRDYALAIMHHNQSVKLDKSYANNPTYDIIMKAKESDK